MTCRIAVAALVLLCMTGQRAWSQSCSTSATGLVFGSYQPLAGSTSGTVGNVTITCNPGLVSLLISYTVSLGTGGSGSYVTRTLSAGGGRLNYQIYKDALYTQVWGDGTSGSTSVTDGYVLAALGPVSKNYPAYGLISASQRVPIGSYIDTITVLVSY